ncbi:MAG: DegT/DnrJ/EryC1/StrS family aminotransferase, partial [Candidatus Nanohaloarchaea archaeon]
AYMREKLEGIDEIRTMEDGPKTRSSFLHFPLLISRDFPQNSRELREHLEERGIETRPVLSGNITRHSYFQQGPGRKEGGLEGADHIHENGLYVSCHPYLTESHMDHVAEAVREFFG